MLALPRSPSGWERFVFPLEEKDGIHPNEPRQCWQLPQPEEKLEELLELCTIPVWSVVSSLPVGHVGQCPSLSPAPNPSSWQLRGKMLPIPELGQE